MKRFAIVLCVAAAAACSGDEGSNNANGNANGEPNNANGNTNGTPNNDNGNTNNTNVDPLNNTNVGTNGGTNNTIFDCGDLTFEGVCSDATTASYCDEDFGPLDVFCPDNYGANSVCVDIPDWGADCAVPAGDSCYEYDADLDDYFPTYCVGPDAGCVWSAADALTCADNVGTCVEEDFAPACDGDLYVFDCNLGQPVAADCVALGGTCDDALGCVMPAGGVCDDNIAVCEGGAACTIPDGEDVGTCG